jgi:hypothetical protein
MKNAFTLKEQIQSNIEAFGFYEAAKLLRKKVPFTLYHFFAFGYLPRAKLTIQPIFYGDAGHATYKAVVVKGMKVKGIGR